MTTRPIQIDGGQGEGGGQVLRMGLAMAAIRGTPVEVHSIRAGRRRPGLQPQHLAAVRALARVCHGRVEGDAPGSMWLSFWPGTPTPGEYRFDIGTAGSATLVVQALLPVLATAGGPSRVSVRGGTHVPWSPPADYMREVLCPVLGAMGLDVRCETSAWGLYPAGGGELLVEIAGSTPLRPLSRLRSAGPLRVRGLSVVSRLSPEIAERQRDRAARRLQAAGLAADIAVRDVAARDPGTFVWLVVEAEGPLGGFSALGRRGVPAEQVADEAVDALLEFVRADAGCDPHLADQLILPMALAAGTSRITTSRVTRHLLTILAEVQQLLGCPVEIRGDEGSPGSVTVEGCGASAECPVPGAESGGMRADSGGDSAECLAPSAERREVDPQSATGHPHSSASDIPHSAFRIPHSPSRPIRKALAADVPGMQRLLAHFASRGDVLPRTLNEMYQHLRDFFVWEEQGEILGIVALFLYWEDLAEVRSLAVSEAAAGRGIGSGLVRACLDEARALGVRRVFALTNRPGFFERLGFREVDKRELPQKIWKDCIRCAKFAACDETALIREA